MPGTPPIIQGLTAAMGPVLQPGSRFSNKTYGLDDGRRKYLVHPDCAVSKWPQKGAQDKENPGMYVVDVTDVADASSLIELEIAYSGIAGKKPARITPDCDLQMLTIPVTSGGTGANMVVPIPQPKAAYEYVSTIQPTYTGIGTAVTAAWLPTVPSFSLTLTPDPSKPSTINYFANEWVLQGRSWDEIVPGKVWFVREHVAYYYAISST